VKSFHPHRCRHDYAIEWLRDNGNMAALQEHMGHASIATTMRYARLTRDRVEREARRVFEAREEA